MRIVFFFLYSQKNYYLLSLLNGLKSIGTFSSRLPISVKYYKSEIYLALETFDVKVEEYFYQLLAIKNQQLKMRIYSYLI